MNILPQPTLEKQATVWYGCYDRNWVGISTQESMAHPAKFSRNLVNRIYAYALERGWLKPGDTVLDCFGGVGLGALDAGANGLNWIGVELEKRFADLGQGCDCTGISKADWIQFYGRWDRVAHTGGRHWCPKCLAEAKQVTASRQLSLFEPDPSAAYVRNSGITPETKPHHYTGNLELFRKYAQPGTFAVLLNGDSRYLRQVIGGAVADGLLSSPPYAGSRIAQDNGNDNLANFGRVTSKGRYGLTDGQLGGMSEGSLDGAIGSPPYVSTEVNPGNVGNAIKRETWGKGVKLAAGISGYGESAGQLGAMPAGSLADSLLSSPPFAGNSGGRGEASRNGIDAALFDRHSGGMKKGTGDDPGNLDHLPMRGFSAAVGSPPYNHPARTGETKEDSWSDGRARPVGASQRSNGGYGSTPGQLGTEQGGTFWAAARMIVGEAYLALKDDSYQFWVCKSFIRDGKRVDFPDQWRQLCEACGFEYVETIRAMLVKDNGTQAGLDGEDKRLRVERKSFFRRLFESRLDEDEDHLRIDYEEIVVMRKPDPQLSLFEVAA